MQGRTGISHASRSLRVIARAALVVLLSLVVAVPAAAQERGTITGTVVRAPSGQPLSNVQVYLPDTGLGTLTRSDGRFLIQNVPAGEHEVRAERLGFGTTTRQVSVDPGATLELELTMEEEALGLDELVVTGTAGAARRREIGNSISEIRVDEQVQTPTSVDQLLQGRQPGVTVLEGSGSAGSGSQIRLRGNVSVAMSNEPLIYIDGIRVRNEGLPMNVGPQDGSNSSNTLVGPLTGINPDDIERIEIVRGPAATALYGTEAAAGVIQIFTRRGREGDARWTAQIDQGAQWSREFGTDKLPYMRLDPWLGTGWTQRYRTSVSGGREDVRYYLSGTIGDSEGVLPNDAEETYQVRSSFDFSPLEDLQVEVHASIGRDNISNTYSGNNALGLTLNVFRCDFERGTVANYIGSCDHEDINGILDYDLETQVDRLTSGATFRYQPVSRLSNRLTVGYDRIQSDMKNIRPFGSVLDREGSASTRLWTNGVLTLDHVSTLEVGLADELSADVSVGGQLTERNEHDFSAHGDGLPGPGRPTVASGAQIFTEESRLRVITGGFFAQSVFDYRDRYFLTAGLRIDGNSAFGEDFGLETYPRASASYVISEEPFWPESLGETKLRTAFGFAGRAPGAFDAVRTWSPIRWVDGSSGFVPENVGNENLGPERTRELEVGFDGTYLDQRLDVAFTYYDQRTEDALVSVRRAPSEGFQSTQLRNVGSFGTSGIELSLDGTVVEARDYAWRLGLDVSTNRSEVLDIGEAPSFSVGGGGWVEEGEPLPVIKGWVITNADEHAEPEIERNQAFGPNLPTHTIGGRTEVVLPRGIRLSARGEYLGGHYMREALSDLLVARQTAPLCDGITQDLVAGNREAYTAKWRALCDPALSWFNMFIYPADYFRMREIAAQAPVAFAVPGVDDATLSLSLRNAVSWVNDDFLTFDPEIVGNGGMNRTVREVNESIPPLKRFVASLRVVF